tara:strand:+ start:12080 stop:13345 length:1266 start_codon:yes stop_codon:yes gene_type:complete
MSKIKKVLFFASFLFFSNYLYSQDTSQSYAAIPGEIGGQDAFGPYDVVIDWPKDISGLPGAEGWTFGAGQSVFAQSPDRVFYLQRGLLPDVSNPGTRRLPEVGPSMQFPPTNVWRNATRASLPSGGGTGNIAEDGVVNWINGGGRLGIDSKWEYCILVFDREGNVIEAWNQWDSMLQRPHFVAISPYDEEKNVWIVDDHKHVIHKFTNDGKTLLQTIGTYGQPGDDETHFNRPAFMDWFPDGSFVVADGYNGTRVVKFDKDGNYLTSWGQAGNPPNETRPGYMNNVHGVAVDPETNRVFVNDRANQRIQVFTEDGEYLFEWNVGPVGNLHLFNITADGYLWAADRNTHKILKYDLEGNFLYSWGSYGNYPGGVAGVHGMSVDQEGNVYLAQVDNKGGVQKFSPREGANPNFLMGPAIFSGE